MPHLATRGATPSAGETPTRDRVLRDVSALGPITTSQLVDRLGLTETAVRRHIENLLAEGLIEPHHTVARRRTRGRPAKAWVVSSAGHAQLRSDYDDLAGDAIRFLAAQSGPEAVRAFADQRADEMRERWAPRVPAPQSSTVQERTLALVSALNREGYAATARPVGDADQPSPLTGVQLCQGHCPVQHVAAEFPEFCDAETEAISQVLGVHVQRLATLANGDHACTTFVPGVSPEPVSPSAPANERSRR